jgi:hypothetical protein
MMPFLSGDTDAVDTVTATRISYLAGDSSQAVMISTLIIRGL